MIQRTEEGGKGVGSPLFGDDELLAAYTLSMEELKELETAVRHLPKSGK